MNFETEDLIALNSEHIVHANIEKVQDKNIRYLMESRNKNIKTCGELQLDLDYIKKECISDLYTRRSHGQLIDYFINKANIYINLIIKEKFKPYNDMSYEDIIIKYNCLFYEILDHFEKTHSNS